MTEQPAPSDTFQWKWVGITFIMFALFYLLPIIIVGKMFSGGAMSKGAEVFVGSWSVIGAIVIAALAGFLSEGVTIWEPAIAGICAILLWAVILFQAFAQRGAKISTEFIPYLFGMTMIVFLLSLFGATVGERIQELRKKNTTAKQ